MTINEDLLLDNTSTTFNGAVNVGGLSINTLVATDGSGAGRLTTTVSGLSPQFTGLNLSGLTASRLIATDASKNLTTTVSGLSPGFTGLSLSGLTASTLVATDGSKNLTSSTSTLTPTFAGVAFANGVYTSSISLDSSGITNLTASTTGQFNINPVTGSAAIPKKINLYDNGNTDSRFCGFGIDATANLIFHERLNSTGWTKVWAVGVPGSTPTELMRLGGNSQGLAIGTDTITRRLTVNSATGDCLRLQYNTSTGTATNYVDFQCRSDGKLNIVASGGTTYAGNFAPITDATYQFGSSGLRWTSGNFSSNVSIGGGSVSTPGLNFDGDTNTGIYRIGADNIGIACNGTKLMDILSSGNTQPIQPSFNAYPSADLSSQTGDNTSYTIVWNSENHDAGSNYATGTGFFTAPVAGRYHFSCTVNLIGLTSSHTKADLLLNDGTLTYARTIINPWAIRSGDNTVSISVNTTVQLSASANMRMILNVSGGTKVVGVAGGRSLSWFCGQLLS
jgi:hypothetical protein